MKKILVAFGVALLPLPSLVSAVPAPFNVSDMTPLAVGYGIPGATGPAVLKAGQWQWQLGLNISNTLHIESRSRTNEQLLVDAETSRHTLTLEYGLTDDWDVRLEVPFVKHEAGSLDGFINDFHGAFGLPEGARPGRADDQFQVRYDRGGQTLVNVQNPQSGLGDAAISFVRTLDSEYEDSLSIGFKLKFPTGEDRDLTGSGTHDLAIWATAGNQLNHRWDHYVTAGGVVIEDGEGLLADVRKSAYGFVRYGLTWQASQMFDLKLQAEYQSDIYKQTETRLLGHSTSVVVGATMHMSESWDLDMALVEDADVDTTSDVIFHIGLRKRYGG